MWRLVARLLVGGFFIGHGTQKLLGWFGGEGPEQTGAMFESLGLQPGERHARAAGLTETAGGAALVLGLATPAAAAALIAVMVTAIRKVHADKGPWITQGGYEYNAVLVAVLLALAEEGPGPVSLDGALGIDRSGPEWAAAALAAGVAGSFVVAP
jgi:putative oxidoreductase